MPSKTPKQAAFMRAVSHDKEFAKKVGVPQNVGKDFEAADEARRKGRGKRKGKLDRLYKTK